MALVGTDVRVYGAGHVYVAPLDTAAPPDLDTEPADPWVDLGYMTTDGVTLSFGRESTDLFAWQSLDPIRTVKTSEPKTAAFTMMQSGVEQFKLALGGGTWAASGVAPDVIYTYTPPDFGTVDERAMVIDFIDGDKSYRYHFPRVLNKEAVEMKAVNDDAFTFPITMSVLIPTSGPTYTIISNDAAAAETAMVAADAEPELVDA